MTQLFISNAVKKSAITLAMLSGLAMPAFAQVTLNVGDNVVVTAINGQEIKNGLLTEPKRTFHLEAGKHVISAKYNRLFELRGDNHDVLRSSNISIPVELTDNQSYDLVMAGQPNDYNRAKDYVKQPTLAVMQNGRTLATQKATDGTGTGIFSGLGNALGGVFGGSSKAVQSHQQAISALDCKAGNTIPAIATTSTTVTTMSADTLDQFMQLWLKATPAEREKMRSWIQK